MNILMVIPARSGSRRYPHKNVAPLGGKPLLLWTVDAALEAKRRLEETGNGHKIDVCLSTDSADYMRIVSHHTDKVHLVNRSGPLAEDCDTALVIKHAMEMMEINRGEQALKSFYYDALVTLQPTSPFRTWKDIIDCINLFKTGKNAFGASYGIDCVFTTRKVTEFPQWMFTSSFIETSSGSFDMAMNYLGIPVKYLSGIIAQDLPKLYLPNGAIYVSSRELIMAKNPRIYGDRCCMVVMDATRSLDIEEEQDLQLAEWLLKTKRLKLE